MAELEKEMGGMRALQNRVTELEADMRMMRALRDLAIRTTPDGQPAAEEPAAGPAAAEEPAQGDNLHDV